MHVSVFLFHFVVTQNGQSILPPPPRALSLSRIPGILPWEDTLVTYAVRGEAEAAALEVPDQDGDPRCLSNWSSWVYSNGVWTGDWQTLGDRYKGTVSDGRGDVCVSDTEKYNNLPVLQLFDLRPHPFDLDSLPSTLGGQAYFRIHLSTPSRFLFTLT